MDHINAIALIDHLEGLPRTIANNNGMKQPHCLNLLTELLDDLQGIVMQGMIGVFANEQLHGR